MASTESANYRRKLLLWGGTVGFGLGAIIDVVIFHLVFQHHHILSGYFDPHSYEGMRTNVMYDGIFLALMFGVLFLGLVMLWQTTNRAQRRLSGLFLSGAIVTGAGVFNVFDGTINHYVLDLHNVVHNTEAWNPHWVVVSLVMLGVGISILYFADGPTYSDTPDTE
jgi:uncharacterized membrane protein